MNSCHFPKLQRTIFGKSVSCCKGQMCCLRKRHQAFRVTVSLRTVLCPVWGPWECWYNVCGKESNCPPPPKFIGLSTVQNSPWEVAAQAGMLLSSPMSGEDVGGAKVAVLWLSSIYASDLPVGRCPQGRLGKNMQEATYWVPAQTSLVHPNQCQRYIEVFSEWRLPFHC